MSESEAAAASAEAVVRDYYLVIDQLGADPSKDLAVLGSVAVGDDLESWHQLLQGQRDEGLHQTGTTVVEQVDAASVNLDSSDPENGPAVQVDVCFDVSDVDVVDESGTSVVAPDRQDSGWIRHTVTNPEWDSDPTDGWRVSASENLDQPPCESAD